MISCAQAGLIGAPQGFQRYSAANKVYVDLAQPGGGWDAQSIPYGASPAVVSGDEMVADALSVPAGYVDTATADGILSLDAGGDASRQLIGVDIYDFSLRAYYGAATDGINDQAPAVTPLPGTTVLHLNQAMAGTDLSAPFNDPESDAITYAVTSGAPPTGTSVDNAAQWTGTPTGVSTGTFDLAGTDPYGAAGILTVTWAVVDLIAIPNVVGSDLTTGEDAISAANLVPNDAADYSGTVAAGIIIRQSPTAGTPVLAGSTVILTVSLGKTSSRPRRMGLSMGIPLN